MSKMITIASPMKADRRLFKQADESDHIFSTDAIIFRPQSGDQRSHKGTMKQIMSSVTFDGGQQVTQFFGLGRATTVLLQLHCWPYTRRSNA